MKNPRPEFTPIKLALNQSKFISLKIPSETRFGHFLIFILIFILVPLIPYLYPRLIRFVLLQFLHLPDDCWKAEIFFMLILIF